QSYTIFLDWKQLKQTEIKKVCKFFTALRTELQIAVHLFGKNTWAEVVNRAKTCKLTYYSIAIYITPNFNNNIITSTFTSFNSVEIIIKALTKYIENSKKKIEKNYSLKTFKLESVLVNTEGPDASQNNTNLSMIYLKEEDKNNINEIYVKKEE
ncbi:31655_t:CDS:2, partial [Racocetra persica]